MKLIKPSFEILEIMRTAEALQLIEQAGRTCYKSEDKITSTSCISFVQRLLKLGHESVLEHSAITVKFIVDRGVTHELVRHRLVAYSQESTRYCNYSGGITFIIPPWIDIEEGEYKHARNTHKNYADTEWILCMLDAERRYRDILSEGWLPQQARSILPNSLKTEIVATANFREWRHILKLRTSKAAHPQMREIMIPLLKGLKGQLPIIFDDIEVEE